MGFQRSVTCGCLDFIRSSCAMQARTRLPFDNIFLLFMPKTSKIRCPVGAGAFIKFPLSHTFAGDGTPQSHWLRFDHRLQPSRAQWSTNSMTCEISLTNIQYRVEIVGVTPCRWNVCLFPALIEKNKMSGTCAWWRLPAMSVSVTEIIENKPCIIITWRL